MDESAPRLPLLGGRQSHTHSSSAPLPSTPYSPVSVSSIDPANRSYSPQPTDRLEIDAELGNSGVPLASRHPSSSSEMGTADAAAVQSPTLQQQPTRLSKLTAKNPSSGVSGDALQAAIKNEVLCGKPPRESSPEAAAAVPREELYSSLEEEGAEEELSCTDGGNAKVYDTSTRAADLQGRAPAIFPERGLAHVYIPLATICGASAAPTSPVSVSSSAATDTPRSILRQPNATGSKTPRLKHRRISFVGVSPPSPDKPSGRRNVSEESKDDSDDYESAEPSLRYDIDTPVMSSTPTPPRHAREVYSHDISSSNSCQNSPGGEEGSTSKVVRSTELPRSDLVTAPSAPPSPEEEGDEVSLSAAPQHRVRIPQRLRRPSEMNGDLSHASSPRRRSAGQDEDVLTQPHKRDEMGSVFSAAAAVRRPPLRQRWPSDAYHDDPPTEVSDTPRTGRSRRESLDPEDDMGSSSSSHSSDADSSSTGTNRAHLQSHDTPVNMHQGEWCGGKEWSTSSSPPVLTTAGEATGAGLTAEGYESRSSSPHLPQKTEPPPSRHSSIEGGDEPRSCSGSLSSRSSGSKSSSDGSSLPPLTQQKGAEEPSRGSTSHEQDRTHHRGTPGSPPSSPTDSTESLSTLQNRSRDVQLAGRKQDEVGEMADASAPPSHREANPFPSATFSPSTITENSSGQSLPGDLPDSSNVAAAQEMRRVPSPRRDEHHHISNERTTTYEDRRLQDKSVPLAPASTATAPPVSAKARRNADAVVGDEPQVYVDPLLTAHRRPHEFARVESPLLNAKYPLTVNATGVLVHKEDSQPYQRGLGLNLLHECSGLGDAVQKQPSSFGPASLRDVMLLQESPSPHSRHGTSLSQPSVRAILRRSADTQQNHLYHRGEITHDAAHLLTSGAADKESTDVSSSSLSSGGVPAEDLVWDVPMAQTRATGRVSPPVSPRPSSEPAPTTPGGRKVFRKKLVVVVRRKKVDSPASEVDPIVQMSLLPFKEGAAALLATNTSRPGSRHTQRARSVDAFAAEDAPALEKLIERVEQGHSTAACSDDLDSTPQHRHRRPGERSQKSHGGGELVVDDVISEGDRIRFRRALSAISSRSVSPRASVSPSATGMTARSHSSSTPPPSRYSVPGSGARSRRRSDSTGRKAESSTADGAQERTYRKHRRTAASVAEEAATRLDRTSPFRLSTRSHSRYAEGRSTLESHSKHRHKSRQGDRHHRRAHSCAERLRRSISAPAMPGAPYRAAQNDEYYGGLSMERDVEAMKTLSFQGHLGITPMPMQLLPRLVPGSGAGGARQERSRRPYSNISAGLEPDGRWPSSDSDVQNSSVHITDATDSRRHERPLRLQLCSGTQTEQAAMSTLTFGTARSGMPLLAMAPVQRTPAIGPIRGTRNLPQPSHVTDTQSTPLPVVVASEGSAPPDGSAGRIALNARTVLTKEKTSAPLSPVGSSSSHSTAESPALFVKREKEPVAAENPFTTSISSVRRPRGSGPVAGDGEVDAFRFGTVSQSTPRVVETRFQSAAKQHVISTSATVTGSTVVPLFMPLLTVDNVTLLSTDWQSTLRERSSKAKQKAMEQFLIASAEAGAAAAAAAAASPLMNVEGPSNEEQPRLAHTSLPSTAPRSLGGVEVCVPNRSGTQQSAVQRVAEQPQAGRYPSPPSSGRSASVEEAAPMVARSVSRSNPSQTKNRGSVEKHTRATSIPIRDRDGRASSKFRRSRSNADPPTEAVSAEGSSVVAVDSPRRRSGNGETCSETDHVIDVAEAATPPAPTAPLFEASVLAEGVPRQQQDEGEKNSLSGHRSCSVGGNAAPGKAVVTAAFMAPVASSGGPPPPHFSIALPETEFRVSPKKEKAARRRQGHDHHREKHPKSTSRRGISALDSHPFSSCSSEESLSRKSKKEKKSKKNNNKARHSDEDKHRKRRQGHGCPGRSSRNLVRSPSTRRGDVAALETQNDSDVDSDLATSIVFQLSRLHLLREAAALVGAASSAEVDASRRHTRKKDKARATATARTDATKKDEHRRRHRSRSSTNRAKASSMRPSKRRTDYADQENKIGKERYLLTSSPKPGPLPPPPVRQQSPAPYGQGVAVGDHDAATSPHLFSEEYTQSHFRPSSSRPYFKDRIIYSDRPGEGSGSSRAHNRAVAHTWTNSEMVYNNQRSSVAAEQQRWSNAVSRTYRTASRTASAMEDIPSRCRSTSNPSRSSTLWHGYVRDSERGTTSGASLFPRYTRSSYIPSSTSYRRSGSTGAVASNERSHVGNSREGLRNSALPASLTNLATYTNRRQQAYGLDDIDDLPRRRYFNDSDRGNSEDRGGKVQHDLDSDCERHRSRSAASDHRPGASHSLFSDNKRYHPGAKKGGTDAGDILVSTPPQASSGEGVFVVDKDHHRFPHAGKAETRSAPIPPPPLSPIQDPVPRSAVRASSVLGAASHGEALPIVREHTVTDAQAADDFVQGVRDIIGALQLYQNSV